MSWFRWFHRENDERQLRKEVEAHLAERVDDLREGGLSDAEARRQARREFGNAVLHLEDSRQVWHWRWLDDMRRDVRYSASTLARRPGFSAVAILTVALATGVSTALFSVIDAAILRPLPFPRPEEIVGASIETRREGFEDRPLHPSPSPSDMRRWRNAGVFSALAAWNSRGEGVLEGPVPERARVRDVSEEYFQLHGVVPRLGRDFTAADTIAGAPAVMILSHAYWQARLGADPDVVGRTIRYDGTPTQVVGVLPAGVHPDVTVWRPMRVDPARADNRGSSGTVFGRLRPGLHREDAERLLSSITPVGDARSPTGEAQRLGARVRLASVQDETVATYSTTVGILAAAVSLIVLIACVNLAGLLLARGATRHPELAIRVSLGAGRLRLIRQLLIESLVICLAGCAAGVLLAGLSLDGLLAILPMRLPASAVPSLSPGVLSAAVGLALTTGLVVGLVPAVRLSRVDLARPPASRSGLSLSRRAGQALIAGEVAMAVVLVLAAGLMIRSFSRLTSVDLGFDPDAVIAFNVLPLEREPSPQRRYYSELLDAIRALPGVGAAGAVDYFALSGTFAGTVASADGRTVAMSRRQILPGYLEAMGVRTRQGRFPVPADGGRVAVLNESAAKALFPNGALGQQFTMGGPFSVVGVVADFTHGGPSGRRSAEAYVPFDPAAVIGMTAGMTVVVRPARWTASLGDMLRQTAEGIGPRVLVDPVRPGREWFGDRVATPRHRTVLLGLLGALGLSLTLVGIFSVTAFAVARRTQEIGVRMAFGARPGAAVWHVVRDAIVPVGLGLAAGLAVAFFATRVIASFLFETTPTDPVTFVTGAVMLLAAALLAAWLPARRAARIDPVVALRAE
jgi:putative ABC transport system permease protein